MNPNETRWRPSRMVLSAPNLSEKNQAIVIRMSDAAILRMLGRTIAHRVTQDPPQFLPVKWPKWRMP